MAPKYHREDDVDTSSIFPSRALDLEHAGCVRMGSGREQLGCSSQAGSAQTQHGNGTEPGAGPAEPAAFLPCSSSNSHLGQGGGHLTSLPRALRKRGALFPLHEAASTNLCLLLTGRESFPPQHIKKDKCAVKQLYRAGLLPACAIALSAAAPHGIFALSQGKSGVLGAGPELSILSPNRRCSSFDPQAEIPKVAPPYPYWNFHSPAHTISFHCSFLAEDGQGLLGSSITSPSIPQGNGNWAEGCDSQCSISGHPVSAQEGIPLHEKPQPE